MTELPQGIVKRRLEGLDQVPSLPVVLGPLLRYLEQPIDQLDMQKVVDLISQDESLAAQCIHMANSPLFGRWQKAESVRDAVLSLGLHRMRDIALSCSIITLVPSQSDLDPTVFWEHSLGCALICRRFAQKIDFPDPGKAYLGGLLHDLGIIVNLWILPRDFHAALELARLRQAPLFEAEREIIGLTHCESGQMLAERWNLTPDLVEAVSKHHEPEHATRDRSLLCIIALSDLLCRMGPLGHGFTESRQVDFQQEPAFEILLSERPSLKEFDWARFTFELDGYLDEVHHLVSLLYRPQ